MKKNKESVLKKVLTKENVAFFSIALILCLGVAVSKLNSSDIPLHDGDVLVDSASIASEETEASKGEDFAQRRATLELERNEILGKCDEETKSKIIKFMEQEVACENIIETKKLPSCLVIITDSRVNVTVDEENLKQDTVAKICNVIMEETGRNADKIVIQSKY
ncbi:MAG: SpoIIIAH-like family protein [Eubacteriaceae bacterium]|nr:SpoIIIAH-like family protein [Eubacteriaceae bacterium]